MSIHKNLFKKQNPNPSTSIAPIIPIAPITPNPNGSTDISIPTLNTILNMMDELIFVTDPITDEILFISDKLYSHKTSHTSNFPPQLEAGGRFYRKTERKSTWLNNKPAIIHNYIDITELRETEAYLEKRLQQQSVLASVSQSFISNTDMDILINNALQITGEIMEADRIVLAEYDKNEGLLIYRYELYNDTLSLNFSEKHANRIKFAAGSFMYDTLSKNNFLSVVIEDAAMSGYTEAKELGLRAVLVIPVYIMGEIWGVLEFDKLCAYKWQSEDMNAASLISNVISGAVTRHNAENKMAVISDFFRIIRNPIFELDTANNFITAYSEGFSFAGLSAHELKGRNIGEFLDKEDYTSLTGRLREAVASHVQLRDFPCRVTDGGRGEWDYTLDILPVCDVYGSLVAYRATYTDVTEKKNAERALIEAKEAAEKASLAKGEFLSRMSHEMRTPMNAIIGMTNIAKNAEDIQKVKYCLEKIDMASSHLLSVINDILDMSKIEANKFVLSESEFSVEDMLNKLIGILQYRIEERKQRFSVNLDINLPGSIIADEQHLSQVITNLMSNAIKFTPENGEITLDVSLVGERDDKHILRFSVEDTGIGITPEQQARLFTSFEQAEGGIARKYGGTGLGLVISKHIVEMMGGRIWIESEYGKGSKFSFTIKAGKGGSMLQPELFAGINKNELKILAVDDSSETREYFMHLMQSLGLSCDVASDGYEAVDLIQKHSDKPYNMFFVDWQMPGMNGIELTKRIRRVVKDNTIVIMISVVEWNEIEKDAKEAGVDCFIPKPLFTSKIVNIINKYIGISQSKETGEIKENVNRYLGRTILLAEDIDVNREIIAAMLENTGIEIVNAANGQEAINLFNANPAKYSLILMDIQMPEMDGYEAVRRIRQSGTEEAKRVPIIAMTADVFKEDIDNCIAAGMNDHIGKPTNNDELYSKLDKFLVNKATEKAPEKEKPQGYAAYLPIIDVEDGIKRLVNKKSLYLTLLKSFKGRQMADDLINHLKSNEQEKAAQAAHAIKGVAINLGLKELAEVATGIEKQAKMNIAGAFLAESLDNATNTAIEYINKLLEAEKG